MYGYLPVYVCNVCVHGTRGGQKRALDPLELELQMVIICHVGAGNQTRSSCPAANAPNCWAICPAPAMISFNSVWHQPIQQKTGPFCLF